MIPNLAFSTIPHKAVAALVAVIVLFGAGFYAGRASRQDEVDEAVNSLIACRAVTELQNVAVRRLQAAGDAQARKILEAQARARTLRREVPTHPQPPDNCAGALAWGQNRARELSEW